MAGRSSRRCRFSFLPVSWSVYYFEARGNPNFDQYGVTQAAVETASRRAGRRKHGRQGSPLRRMQLGVVRHVTTDASCGAVNSMHDSYTPLGGWCRC